MQIGKGDIPGQRRRRRSRYRGCRVCGVRGVHCTECWKTREVVGVYDAAGLSVVVDGSFVEAADRNREGLGHGGAGLVLVRGAEILASRACGFRTPNSTDAELQAIIRAARWVPDVAIYTDARDLPIRLRGINPRLTVHYLHPNQRGDAHALAHRLSVEGRCREAPETIPSIGLDFALERSQLTKAERKARAVDLLLEEAGKDPSFDGDFAAIAERFGWTSGRQWRQNPAIRIATERWQAEQSLKRGETHVDGL